MGTRFWHFGALLSLLSLPLCATIAMGDLVDPSAAAQTVVINNLTVRDGSVSGSVVNKSSATLRGVELLLRQDWQWNDERHPGADNPGRAVPFTLAGDVAPHASAPFAFEAPRLPQRSDGQFVTTMEVVRFTEVGP